jgi:signal transduction histidine kinase
MFRGKSIRWQLTFLIVAIAAVALLINCGLVMAYQFYTGRKDLERELRSVAAMIGTNTTAALQFGDPHAAREVLDALAADARTTSGTLYTADGTLFARWSRDDGRPKRGVVSVGHPISFDGERLGRLVVTGDLNEFYRSWKEWATLVMAALFLSACITLVLSIRLQSVISDPILELADKAERVSVEGDYSVRVPTVGAGEVRLLCDRFNHMLEQVENRDRKLHEAHDVLRQRTGELEVEVLERRAAEDRLVIAKEAAEAANRAKSTFLANVSHELRTPLNAVIGYSELLREDAEAIGGAAAASDLGKISKAAHHLLSLITDVLDLSKIEAGRLSLAPEPTALAELITDVAATASALAVRNGNRLHIGALGDLPTVVLDPVRLSQVLLNLLGNAAKFTEGGVIGLEVDIHRSPGSARLRFSIWDTGIGIPEDKQEVIFGEFVQVDPSARRRFGGTGLGLPISRQLCRLMGGDISVVSSPGNGSTFTVDLPLVEATAEARTSTAADADRVPS